MRIKDIENTRTLNIEGHNKANPNSVFIVGPTGFCMEFDRLEFVTAMCKELDLTEMEPVFA